jgi:hypothetical protein
MEERYGHLQSLQVREWRARSDHQCKRIEMMTNICQICQIGQQDIRCARFAK